jgi:hypothetical protein
MIRPSTLPKLALCARYESEPIAGAAAARGTLIDEAARELLAGGTISGRYTREIETAARWCAERALSLAGGLPLESREDALKTDAEEPFLKPGTADLLCVEGGWSADFKSGQIRNYLEQQAAYALGFMLANWVEEWTVYLLYPDQETVITLRYTLESARKIVRDVLAKHHDPETLPTPNEYCGWCVKRWSCTARREALGWLPVEDGGMDLDTASLEQLRDFALWADTVAEFRDRAAELLKERVQAGGECHGVTLSKRAGSETVPPNVVELHLRDLGTSDVLDAYGPLAAKKLREIWAKKCPSKPFPEDKVQAKPGTVSLRITRPK